MEKSNQNDNVQSIDLEFQKFVWIRIALGIFLAIILLWVISMIIHWFSSHKTSANTQPVHAEKVHETAQIPLPLKPQKTETASIIEKPKAEAQPLGPAVQGIQHVQKTEPSPSVEMPKAIGVGFVEALIKPLNYELNERFWGWRSNDVIQFTDNINEFQLGVLEVTRRATTRLTDNISRTGSTAALNPHLEQAMNGLMLNSDSYLFPPAETQYRKSLEKLDLYREQLEQNQATFYNRPDNLIPLLHSFEELLGSCDENLVKTKEDNGDPVSSFKADNYFYYAKGVASAMLPMLEAMNKDFEKTLDVRNSKEILHHAIESCQHAADLEPWLFITEASLNGIFANHRANMAAHISHARFYVGLLAESLST